MAEKKEVESKPYEGNNELFSPPRPTRLIQIKAPTASRASNSSDNPSSLPALAGQVALAQKNHIQRLEKRVEFLDKVKETYHEALRKKALVEREVQAVSRKSNLLQDDIESCQTTCDSIQKEIGVLVCDTEALKQDIESAEMELSREKRNYEKYRTKMENHKKLVEIAESSNEVNKNIERVTQGIELLKKEKESLLEGTDFEKLLPGEVKEIALAALVTLEETKSELEGSLKTNIQIDGEEAKQKKLKRETELLQKKYQAQLTWTKKQLQETSARNKQWDEEASQTERKIQELREKLDQ